MQMQNIKKTTKQLSKIIGKHSPTILSALSIVGLSGTVYFSVAATPKAMQVLDDAKREYRKTFGDEQEPLTKKEVVKHVWKLYIPAALMGAFTIGCIISSNRISVRRTAALSSLYTITESAFREYKTQVAKAVGNEKAKEITNETHQVRMSQTPQNSNEVIPSLTGNSVLCYDTMSGRYFKSDMETIRKVINNLNETMLYCDCVSLNDLYYGLGLPNTKMGNEVGWSSDDRLIEIDFGTVLSPEGIPCLVLDYTVFPKYEYDC